MSGQMSPRISRRIGGIAFAAARVLVWLAVLSRFIPAELRYPGLGLEQGYKFPLAMAAAQGRAFGSAIVFTYGPYGALWSRQYVPGDLAPVVLASVLLGCAFYAGIMSLACGKRRALAWLTPFMLALIPDADPLLFVVPLLAIGAARQCVVDGSSRGAPRVVATLLLQMSALAILPLVKGSMLPASAIGGIASMAVLVHWGRCRLASLSAAWLAASCVALWLAAGQSIALLLDYFDGTLQLILGYSEAMAHNGSVPQLLLFLILATAALVVTIRGLRLRRAPGDFALAVGAVAIVFLAFKAGFVRQDLFHVPIAVCTLGLVCWLMLFVLPRGHAVALSAIAGLIGLWAPDMVAMQSPQNIAVTAATQLWRQGEGIVALVFQGGDRERRYAQALEGVRTADPLPEATGSADIYGWDQSGLLATELPWDPRPVLQSYSAYTPYLASLNVQHLTGATAPDNIFFRVEPIDGRLAATEDGASWPALLSLYDVVSYQPDMTPTGGVALLRRKAEPIAVGGQVAPLPSLRATFDREVPLPRGAQPLWASIDIRPTLLGWLSAALFKPPSLTIALTDEVGRRETFRLVSGMARAGFLLSPVVHDTPEFLAVAGPDQSGYFAGRRPVSFHVSGAWGTWLLWHRSYRVNLGTIDLPSSRPGPAPDRIDLTALPAPAVDIHDCQLDRINGELAGNSPVHAYGQLRLQGWAAADPQRGLLYDTMQIDLIADGARPFSVPTHRMLRSDLKAAFGNPEAERAGFFVDADITKLPAGIYHLIAILRLGKRNWSCRLPTAVLVEHPYG